MSHTPVLWPAFALVALTLLSAARLARMRFAAARAGRVDPRFYRLFRGEGEPPELAAATRNVVNLYEMPTLFYAGTAIAFAAGHSGPALVALGWAYFACRVVHTVIHVTRNQVLARFRVFFVSWLVLVAYWVVLGVALARGAAAG